MASIHRAVRAIKSDLYQLLDPKQVVTVFDQVGHVWRNRELDPTSTLCLMLLQALHGTSMRGALRIAGKTYSIAAFCKAKQRLPIEGIQRLFLDLASCTQATTDSLSRWHGHRVLMVDGTSCSMPDRPVLQQAFGQPGQMAPGCGFPVMHVLLLMDQASGMIRDLYTSVWNTHDMAHATKLHPMLEDGDILLADRAFDSYAHMALLIGQGLHAVFRVHQRRVVCFKPGRKAKTQVRKRLRAGIPDSVFVLRNGHLDQQVLYQKPSTIPEWMNADLYDVLPDEIQVRELRQKIYRRGFRTATITVVTTLLNPDQYPKAEIIDLYATRWEVETRIKDLKTTLGAAVLRSQTKDGVLKDLWCHALIYNLTCLVMVRDGLNRGIDPRRLSFIDARDTLRHNSSSSSSVVPRPLAINPYRPNRDEPRVIKRKPQHKYATKPREQERQAVGISRLAA